MKRYRTLIVDPPWPVKLADGRINRILGSQLTLQLKYDIMTEDEILNFSIEEFAAEKAILFLWATNSKLISGRPCLDVAFELIERWGFRYRMTLVWVKTHGVALWLPFRGLTEFILVATKNQNNFPPYGKYGNVFEWPITRHSEKPAGFYQMLRSCTPEPRIDIFARRAHYGFNGWGREYVGEGPLMEFLGGDKEE